MQILSGLGIASLCGHVYITSSPTTCPVYYLAFSPRLPTRSPYRRVSNATLLRPLSFVNMVPVFAAIFVPQANEKYFDLCGALGFLSTTAISLYYPFLKEKFWEGVPILLPSLSAFAPRQILLSAAVYVWSIRLGSFLVYVSLRKFG
jgi:hypothetical protein